MITVFDTSTLIYLLKPDAPAPKLPGSEERVSNCQERISLLLSDLQKARSSIIIPTPVIAELLVYSGDAGPDWLRTLTKSSHFVPTSFDTIAAVECAELAKARHGGRKLRLAEQIKAKFDEQIVAIARVAGAEVIYSDDRDIRILAGDAINVRGIADLPLPPTVAQGKLEFQPGEVAEERPHPDDND